MKFSTHGRRAAVLLRGEHAQRDGGWGPLDWRLSFESLMASYIRPRRADGWSVDIFYHTHRTDDSSRLRRVQVL